MLSGQDCQRMLSLVSVWPKPRSVAATSTSCVGTCGAGCTTVLTTDAGRMASASQAAALPAINATTRMTMRNMYRSLSSKPGNSEQGSHPAGVRKHDQGGHGQRDAVGHAGASRMQPRDPRSVHEPNRQDES